MKTFYIAYSVKNKYSKDLSFEGAFVGMNNLSQSSLRKFIEDTLIGREMSGDFKNGDELCIISITQLEK